MSWPRVKLGELCSLVTKGTTPTSVGLDFSARGIPFLRVQNISNSNVSLEDALYIDHLAHETLGRSKIRPGDFLITIAGTIGRTAIVPQDFPESNCNQAVAILRIYEDKLWPKFLLHWLSTDDALGQISGRKVTATISNLSLGQIKELEVPLPSLPEQKRIAAILDKADTIRCKRQQAIQLADDFLRAVFLDIFGDSVTNPNGFRKGSITELAEIITGNAFRSDDYIGDSGAAIRLCRGTNVLTSYFDWSDTAYWPKDKLNGLERYLLSSGDVILAMDRPWISSGLKVCVFPEGQRNTCLVQRVARLRPKEPALSEYIYSCIKSKAFEEHCCPTETTVPHISPVELRSYEVLIPDKTSLFKYNQAVTKIKSAVTGMQEAILRAGDAFESMSQKAFTGQL